MIETSKQAQDAVTEIMSLTDWTLNIVSKKSLVHISTLSRLMAGRVPNPRQDTMDKLEKCLNRVRKFGDK